MRTSTTRSLAARLPLAITTTLAAAALAAGVLAAPSASHASGVPQGAVIAEGPYCPDHPDVPMVGRWVYTRVTNGHHIDVYKVPYFWGYKYVDVRCD